MANQSKTKNYYIGVDVGTDSVGYAVTDPNYNLLVKRGEPIWGSHTFPAAAGKDERRLARTARRRLERRKQRVQLVRELFAQEIAAIDPDFYKRLDASALWRDDKNLPTADSLFADEGYTDAQYHKDYPTIHHLLCDLMTDTPKRKDARLVYLAVAYLVARRGHFLYDVDKDGLDKILQFDDIYQDFMACFDDCQWPMPWQNDNAKAILADIIKSPGGVNVKKEKLTEALLDKTKRPKEEEPCYDSKLLVALLAGGKVDASKLFCNAAYKGVSLCTNSDDAELQSAIDNLRQEESDLVLCAKRMHDWGMLTDALHGKECISHAKVEIYEQHKKDLLFLKRFIRRYLPQEYSNVFRRTRIYDSKTKKYISVANYVAYSYHNKDTKQLAPEGKVKPEDFCKYISKLVTSVEDIVEEQDKAAYQDMKTRLSCHTFLPKQVNDDNRVLPYQVFYDELKAILAHAQSYLPFLADKDADGLTVTDKLLQIFCFKIPYFVGPLNAHSPYAWLQRKANTGRIYPWNLEETVDLDKTEEMFIKRMTNVCTYLPGAKVLPKNSLLYCRFEVLNEINNIKINGRAISVEHKQAIYHLFENKRSVSVRDIKNKLRSMGIMTDGDTLSGIDESIKSSLRSYHVFKRLLSSGTLTEGDAESILLDMAYCSDNDRLYKRLLHYDKLTKEDCRYLCRSKLQEFGRLSREFLCDLQGTDKETGEVKSIMGWLWDTNDNLMQLLSGKYDFVEQIDRIKADYYAGLPRDLNSKLSEMYLSNAVKRPIIRTLDIVQDVCKHMGGAPTKVFVEMARGADDEQKNKRTVNRREQILAIYKSVKENTANLQQELARYSDRELDSRALYLYFLQFGRDMYTSESIPLERLADYDKDHIYPNSITGEDSLIKNMVLTLKTFNGSDKRDKYPIDPEIQNKMGAWWKHLLDCHAISEEKYYRLTRTTPLSLAEKQEFIDRQLVETRQATKALASLLQEKYPDSQVVYVKAKLVADFRHTAQLHKARTLNDLHHAKDAYLNIVVGNVYHSVFNRQWFSPDKNYNLEQEKLFGNKPRVVNGETVWAGTGSWNIVRAAMANNRVHCTRYAFCKHDKLFDLNPLKADSELLPLKSNLDPGRYGGYNKPATSFFVVVRYRQKKKVSVQLVPIKRLDADRYLQCLRDKARAEDNAKQFIGGQLNINPAIIDFPLGLRPIKINTGLWLDGLQLYITGKTGNMILLSNLSPLCVDTKWEDYINRLENVQKKIQKNKNYVVDEVYDKITVEENRELYQLYIDKLSLPIYRFVAKNVLETIKNGQALFTQPVAVETETDGSSDKQQKQGLSLNEQVQCLLKLGEVLAMGRTGGCDLSLIGGQKCSGTIRLSCDIANWGKDFRKVYLLDMSASGLYVKRSVNLLDLLVKP